MMTFLASLEAGRTSRSAHSAAEARLGAKACGLSKLRTHRYDRALDRRDRANV